MNIMKFKLPLLAIITTSFLTGCFSRPISVYEAEQAPNNRIFKYQTPSESKIIVVRDKGIAGSGCYASIFINGETVAKLNAGEKAVFHVSAGDWILGASIQGAGLCALNPTRMERETITKLGDTKVFRTFTSTAGDIDILPSTL